MAAYSKFERLQGQDVDVIIITISCSDTEYYLFPKLFILAPNHMNVMISRAKLKVVLIFSWHHEWNRNNVQIAKYIVSTVFQKGPLKNAKREFCTNMVKIL